MERMDLTFPVFYQCAIKGQTRVPQYHCVNILLYGRFADSKDGATIAQPTTCVYVRGRNQIPGDLVSEISALPKDELLRRFELLHLHDVSAVVNALVRLLDLVSLTDETKNELLKLTVEPGQAYQFIIAMYLTALTAPTVFSHLLSKEQIELLTACRNNTPYPSDTLTITKEAAAIALSDSKDATSDPLDPRSASMASNPSELLCVRKREIRTEDDLYEIADYILTPLSGPSAVLNLDFADLNVVFSHGENSTCSLLECTGKTEEVEAYLRHSQHFAGSDAILFSIECAGNTGLNEFNLITDIVREKCNPDATIMLGANMVEAMAQDEWRICLFFHLPQ